LHYYIILRIIKNFVGLGPWYAVEDPGTEKMQAGVLYKKKNNRILWGIIPKISKEVFVYPGALNIKLFMVVVL
jgi:hypothetical protein